MHGLGLVPWLPFDALSLKSPAKGLCGASPTQSHAPGTVPLLLRVCTSLDVSAVYQGLRTQYGLVRNLPQFL
jgi:hypothetical protein